MRTLYEDKHIIVLDKPAGLPVLPDGWQADAPYLRRMLEDKYEQVLIVHRLDKVTSGVMVVALTADAHRGLNRQFETHQVEKVYHAIVEGLPPWNEHTARHMLQTNVGRKHRTIVVNKRGKKSETEFKVLIREHNWALVEAHPRTGRTHQIRVHLSALGYPILADILYGADETDLISRPALHAFSLTFTHPISGERVSYSVPLPEDMQKLLAI